MKKMLKSKAFTMAEAVLVMTILGIIATIMIQNLRPAQFKEKGLSVLAKTVYGDLDTALSEILVNNTPYNQLNSLYNVGQSSDTFSMATAGKGGEFIKLLKTYMRTSRTECESWLPADEVMTLKNGACIGVKSGSVTEETWIPGETDKTDSATYTYGMIYLDTNGEEEPNVFGKDRFAIPLDLNGVVGD